MKKNKLLIEYEYNFDLIGIISPAREYKLAWSLNQVLKSGLVKQKDIILELTDNRSLIISNFIERKHYGFIQLLKNRSFAPDSRVDYLLPELRQFDFFLLIQDETETIDIIEIVQTLASNNEIQSVVKIDIDKVKSKENLLTY